VPAAWPTPDRVAGRRDRPASCEENTERRYRVYFDLSDPVLQLVKAIAWLVLRGQLPPA